MTPLICILLLSDIVCIRQPGPPIKGKPSDWHTQGTVIRVDDRGTMILTCRHNRTPGTGWCANRGNMVLFGDKTIVDDASDLALLLTKDKWQGGVTTVARDPPTNMLYLSPVHSTLPRGHFLYSLPLTSKPGCSGIPLLVDNQVVGVLWGSADAVSLVRGTERRSCYTQHKYILKFLERK